MEIFALIAYVLIGVVSGLFAGLLGIGGGVITVPCLVFVFSLIGFPQAHLMHTAIGTSLASMILTGIASTIAHHKHKGVVWKIVYAMLPGIIIGCLFGAFIANFLSAVFLEIIFGFFACSLGAYILFSKKKKKIAIAKPRKNTIYSWFGLGIATVANLLGIGGGIFTVPLLLKYQFPAQKAVGTSAATSLTISFFGSFGYFYFGIDKIHIKESLGYIYLPAFFLLGLATIFCAPIGAKMAHRISDNKLRKIFAGTLIIIGILMVF